MKQRSENEKKMLRVKAVAFPTVVLVLWGISYVTCRLGYAAGLSVAEAMIVASVVTTIMAAVGFFGFLAIRKAGPM